MSIVAADPSSRTGTTPSLRDQSMRDRLAGRNLYYLGQIRRILLALQKHLSVAATRKATRGHDDGG